MTDQPKWPPKGMSKEIAQKWVNVFHDLYVSKLNDQDLRHAVITGMMNERNLRQQSAEDP